MIKQAKINGLDIFSAYGVIIEGGLKAMERPAELKDPTVYDWEDENGREYFINGNLKDTDVVLDCAIYSEGFSNVIAKKNAFEMMLNDPSFKTFESLVSGSTFVVKYNKISSFEWIGKFNRGFVRFKLELTIVRSGASNPSAIPLSPEIINQSGLLADGNGGFYLPYIVPAGALPVGVRIDYLESGETEYLGSGSFANGMISGFTYGTSVAQKISIYTTKSAGAAAGGTCCDDSFSYLPSTPVIDI